jgi:anti-sigma factor RsiW
MTRENAAWFCWELNEARMNTLCLEHTSEEVLERYLAQRGSESEIEVVETHLLVCESCRVRLDELEDYRAVMRQGFGLLASQPEQLPARAAFRGLPAWILPRWSTNWSPGWLPNWSLLPAAVALVLAVILVAPSMRRPAGTVEVALTSERGSNTAPVDLPGGSTLQLHLDAAGLPAGQVSVEIVDGAGTAINQQQVVARSNQLAVGIQHLASGTYYARIYSSKNGRLDSGRLLREFVFQVM